LSCAKEAAMEKEVKKPSGIDAALAVLLGLALLKLVIHLLTNFFDSYGLFRDEFYYLACSHRLDAGYVDQPPLSIFLLAGVRQLLGSSLFALRFLPAVFGALTVWFTGLLVRRMKGGVTAVFLAGCSVIAAPILLGMCGIYSMNCLDILLWVVSAWVAVRLLAEDRPRRWILLGVLMGAGLMNKISMAWFVVGFFLALLLTRHRRTFKTPWPYLSALVAFLISLPFVIWNFFHDFAHLEFIQRATAMKYAGVTLKDFLLGQVLLFNPLTIPVWLGGIWFFFFHQKGREYRPLGIIYLTTLLILAINGHSKPEYMTPAISLLFAGGAVWWEGQFRRRGLAWLKYALPALVLAGGLAAAPLALPVLPVNAFVAYNHSLNLGPGGYEGKELSALPQFYADRFGWEDKARDLAAVYRTLTPEEKMRTVAFVLNYGEAGALEYYARRYDLPPVICGHNNYWIWWEREHNNRDVRHLIVLGGGLEELLAVFEKSERVGTHRCDYCMPYEDNLPVFLARDLQVPLRAVWERVKNFQ